MKQIPLLIVIVIILESAGCSRKEAESGTIEKSPQPIQNHSLTALAATAEKSSIDDIVTGLLKAHSEIKVGFEIFPLEIDAIPAFLEADFAGTESEAVSRVSAVIEQNTDYECRFQNHWLIIIPRQKKEKCDMPIALRTCLTPPVRKFEVDSFLRMIAGVRSNESVKLAQNPFFVAAARKGLIDSDARTVPCFQLLSDVADQLSVRCWRVNHMYIGSDGKVVLPLKLSFGYVDFHAPGEIRTGR